MVGTTVEFFDFYIYATAAVLVFPRLFFPASDPASSTLASLAENYGLQYVGYYLTGSAVLTFLGLLLIRETKDDDLTVSPS
jgi:predicted neutral ceramidase superfamily lipid hydrolase